MTPETQQDFIELLKRFQSLQPFTIEELLRLYLTEKGHQWDSMYESATHEDLEHFLKEQELIKEQGTTTVYVISDKLQRQ